MSEHPTAESLAGLFETVALWHEPFLHVLSCRRCAAVAKGVMRTVSAPEPKRDAESPALYKPVFKRASAVAKVMAQAREAQSEQAGALVRELLALSREERAVALVTDERFRNFALAERLLALARGNWEEREEREEREDLAGMAVLLLEGWPRPRQEVLDLRAEAHSELADALRAGGHHETAERELACAAADLRESTDPLCRGAFCRTLAHLRWEQSRFDEAWALIDRAADLFEDGHDPRAQGDALITAGRWALGQGELARATARFDAVLTLAELPAETCRKALRDLVVSLLLDGRCDEAARILRHRGLAVGGGVAAVYQLLADRFDPGGGGPQ